MKKKYLVAVVCIMAMVALCGCGLFGKPEPEIQEIPEDVVSEEVVPGSEEDVIADEPEESESLGTGEFEENESLDVNEPVEESEETAGGARGYFTTTDLYGNTVTQEIFAQSDLTVVNVWATYCGPCINEMPELAEWSQNMPEGVQLVGLVSDLNSYDDAEILELAQMICEATGADVYTSLVANEDFTEMLSGVVGVPTTFFIDGNGVVVGSPVVGANVAACKDFVESYLAE